MASKALYSEVVELILNIDKYESNIHQANSLMSEFTAFAARVSNVKLTLSVSDAVAAASLMTQELIKMENQAKVLNRAVKDTVSEVRRLAEAKDNAARIDLLGGKTDTSDFLAKQVAARNKLSDQAHNEEMRRRSAIAIERGDLNAIIAQENARLQVIRRRVAAEEASIRATASYKVGSFASGARVGAALDLAAGAGFALGGTNIGGALYMMERLAYASGIGQKSLGEVAAKFGLVELHGDNAAASMSRFGASILGIGTAVAVVAAPIGAMLAGGKLDKAVADMSTLLADTTVKGEKFNNMMNDTAAAAARVSESFNLGLVDTVNGFKTALSTGIDADQLESFGTIAATVTKGLGTSFEDAVGILTTFKDSYNLGMQGMRESSDVLFNAINVGKFQVDDLRNNIGRVVTSSAEAGISIKDMSAGLATLTRVGLSTSQSITSLNRFVQAIVSPTDQARKQFDALGLATGHAAFKTQTLMQYLQQLKVAVGGDADLMGQLFTTEQGRRGAIGLTTNLSLTSSIRTAMDDVGTATIAANRAMDTFGQNFGKVFTAVWDVVQLIGRDLLQVANDVFFPGGALSADTLSPLKNVLELIGIAVKEVGVILVSVAGIVVNSFKAIFNSIASIGDLLTGEFASAGKRLSDGWGDLVQSTINGIKAIGSTVGTTFQRMNSNVSKAIESTGEVAISSAELTARAMQSIFGGDTLKAVDKLGDRTKNVFDQMAEAIRAARLEAVKLQFEAQYTPINRVNGLKDIMAPASMSEKNVMDRLRIGERIRDSRRTAIQSDYDKQRTRTMIGEAGGLDPEEESNIKLREDILKARAIRKAEEIGKAEAEARVKARDSWLIANGFGSEVADKTTPTKRVGYGQGGFEQLEKLHAMLGVLKDKGTLSETLDKIVGQAFGPNGGVVTSLVTTSLTEEEAIVKVRTTLTRIKEEYHKHKEQLTAEDRTAAEASIALAEQGVTDLEAKHKKAVAERYKQEYDHALKLYNLKVSAFNKEIDRLDKIIEKYREFQNTLVQRSRERMEDRRGPDYAFRSSRAQAETDVERIRNQKDPTEALRMAEDFLKLIDRMVSQGTSAGMGDRASRNADDLEAVLQQIMKDKGIAVAKDKKGQENNIDNAIAKFKADMASNPVAQAALAQAMVVMKEAVNKAAENGIGVAGDLVQDVNIGSVNVDLDIRKFEQMIRDGAQAMIQQYLRNQKKQNPNEATNDTPTGAEDNL